MANDVKLGVILNGDESRDAVHVAIAPVIAGEVLRPGDHVGFCADNTEEVGKTLPGITPIGVIDPFLLTEIYKGTRCWLFLYPQSITSLKHVWAHPAFAATQSAPLPSKSESEKWLRDFIARADCPDYETVIAAAVGNHHKNLRPNEDPVEYPGYFHSFNDGEYLYFGGFGAHGEIPPEFWDHVEIVTGQKNLKRATRFSCSC